MLECWINQIISTKINKLHSESSKTKYISDGGIRIAMELNIGTEWWVDFTLKAILTIRMSKANYSAN